MNQNKWIIGTIIGVAVLLAILAGVYFLGGWSNSQWGMMGNWGAGMMHGWGFNSFGWIGMALMWLTPIAILILVGIGINGLVHSFVNNGQGFDSTDISLENQPTALGIIQTRYARGDISQDQYKEMLDDIR